MYDVRDVRETGGCDRVGRHVTGSSMQFEDDIITRPLIISWPGRALLPILGSGYSYSLCRINYAVSELLPSSSFLSSQPGCSDLDRSLSGWGDRKGVESGLSGRLGKRWKRKRDIEMEEGTEGDEIKKRRWVEGSSDVKRNKMLEADDERLRPRPNHGCRDQKVEAEADGYTQSVTRPLEGGPRGVTLFIL